MRCALVLVLTTAWLVGSASAQAQKTDSPTPTPQSEAGKRLDEYLKEETQKKRTPSENQILPEASTLSSLDSLDEPTKARALASLREYFDYRISGYQHRKEVFKWQLFSSKLIFYVVILLVLAGVYFSGIQFHHTLGQKRSLRVAKVSAPISKDDDSPSKEPEPEAAELVSTQSDVTEIVASAKGIKVTSPILGVIILVISLLFFYLYLMFVYPINEIL